MLEKCVLTILELNWNQRLGHKWIKLNICHHLLTSSTQLQNRSFHVVERTRTSSKCQKMKNVPAKRAKILFFIVKYANLWGLWEFKIYEAAVAKTSLKIASSSLSIFFVIISVCVTFESWQDYSGTEFRGAVSRLGKKIPIRACVFTFSLKP